MVRAPGTFPGCLRLLPEVKLPPPLLPRGPGWGSGRVGPGLSAVAVNHGRKSSGSKSTSSELLATFVLVISDLIQKEDLFGARKTQGSVRFNDALQQFSKSEIFYACDSHNLL